MLPYMFKLLYTVATSVLLVTGVSGNLLVILVVSRNFQMHTVTNIYLFSLSLVDMFHLVSIVFVSTHVYLGRFVFSLQLCRLYLVLEGVNWFAGTFLLTALSIDRYMSICHPGWASSRRTSKCTIIIISAILSVCLALLSPLAIFAGIVETRPSPAAFNGTGPQKPQRLSVKRNCVFSIPHNTRATFSISMFLMGFALPVLCMAVCYSLIIVRLKLIDRHSSVVSSHRRKSMRRVTRFVFVLVLIYISLWSPYWLTQIVLVSRRGRSLFQRGQYTYLYFSLTTQMLGYVNSALNPLWYAFMSKDFRKLYLKAVRCERS